PRSRVRAPRRRGGLDARAGGRHGVPLGAGAEAGMRRADATRLYYALQILLSMPTWVVMSVYLVQELGLSPLQLVLMGTAMEAAVFLFEIPTGVVADAYSRRLSLIVGYVGMGTTWILVGVVSGLVRRSGARPRAAGRDRDCLAARRRDRRRRDHRPRRARL